MVIDDDTGTLLEARDEILEDFDSILVGGVVDNPPVEVHCETLEQPLLTGADICLDKSRHTIGSLYRLSGEIVIFLEGDSLGKFAFKFWRCGECLREVLNDELDLVKFLRDGLRDESMTTHDIHNGSCFLVDGVPVVVIDEMFDLIAGTGRQRAHGAMELPSASWIFAQGGKHRLLVNKIKRDLKASLGILLRAWEAEQCFEGLNGGLGYVSR
jgi:hypothetical protein